MPFTDFACDTSVISSTDKWLFKKKKKMFHWNREKSLEAFSLPVSYFLAVFFLTSYTWARYKL